MLSQLKEKNLTPEDLIEALKEIPILASEYAKTVRHYKLEDHTLLVLKAFDKYFGSYSIPIDTALFRVALALHDIGKPLAFAKGSKSKQHLITIKIIEDTKEDYPFSEEEIGLILNLLKGDPVGLFFQDKITVAKCAKEIREMHEGCFLNLQDFFKLLTIYYQSDVAAYTKDDGGVPFLEFLFSYEAGAKKTSSNGLLLFSPTLEAKYSQLKQTLTNAK